MIESALASFNLTPQSVCLSVGVCLAAGKAKLDFTDLISQISFLSPRLTACTIAKRFAIKQGSS